jgi:hypothetical protein
MRIMARLNAAVLPLAKRWLRYPRRYAAPIEVEVEARFASAQR